MSAAEPPRRRKGVPAIAQPRTVHEHLRELAWDVTPGTRGPEQIVADLKAWLRSRRDERERARQ